MRDFENAQHILQIAQTDKSRATSTWQGHQKVATTVSTHTKQQAEGFSYDDNNKHARYMQGYTCLRVTVTNFFHLDNEPLR